MEEEKKENKQRILNRFTDEEIRVIKDNFTLSKNTGLPIKDILFKAIRKVMLQLPSNGVEISTIQINLRGEDKRLMNLLRRHYLPTVDGEEPMGQITDFWFGVDVKERMFEEAMPIIKANQKVFKYLSQRLDELETGEKKKGISFVRLSEMAGKTDQEVFIDLIARKIILLTVEQKLIALSGIAGMEGETEEERAERLKRNSTR